MIEMYGFCICLQQTMLDDMESEIVLYDCAAWDFMDNKRNSPTKFANEKKRKIECKK